MGECVCMSVCVYDTEEESVYFSIPNSIYAGIDLCDLRNFSPLLCFLGLTDLHKKAFVFPKETENSYVSLKTQLETPLKAFTVCLYFYTELARTRSYSIFSYATRQQPNEILIFWSKGRGYTFGDMGRRYHSRVSKILKLQHTSVPAGSPILELQSSG